MTIKLNTDILLDIDVLDVPLRQLENYQNKMRALVHYHRLDMVSPLAVTLDFVGNAYSEQFDCTFTALEFEIYEE